MTVFAKVRLFNFLSIGLVLALYVCIGVAFRYQSALNEARDSKFLSIQLAQELRDDSTALTRNARTYVVTGEKKYEEAYNHSVAVRNGEAARADGRKVSAKTLMQEAGFTAEEFALLAEAEKRSNDLVQTETAAMNAVRGLYADAFGKFTVQKEPDMNWARKLMHDEAYHKSVATIAEPIDQFEKILEARVRGAVDQALWYAKLALARVYAQIRSLVTDLSGSSSALSATSTESAASLEETVASLEELTSMIKLNADNAKIASEVSQVSKNTAEEGAREIESLTQSMTEIATASQEQSTGVSQISQAMNQLDQATQSNASSSETISEAGGSLDHSTEGLTATISNLETLTGLKKSA